jgi:hypothetical protein
LLVLEEHPSEVKPFRRAAEEEKEARTRRAEPWGRFGTGFASDGLLNDLLLLAVGLCSAALNINLGASSSEFASAEQARFALCELRFASQRGLVRFMKDIVCLNAC